MSIRLRLALGYSGFFALLVMLLAPAIYITLERELQEGVDRSLAPLNQQVVAAVRDYPRLLSTEIPRGVQVAGGSSADRSLAAEVDRLSPTGVLLEVLDQNGRLVAVSSRASIVAVPVPDATYYSASRGAASGFTATIGGVRYRLLLSPIPGAPDPRGFVLVGRSIEPEDASLIRVRNILAGGSLLGCILAAGVGWLIARNGLSPVDRITETARAIALSRSFGRRLKVDGARDEVGRLATTINQMLDSLDEVHSAQRRFVADASHELRSPLTSIRSNIEILQRTLDAPREDRREALADVASEVDRMSRLASDLLLLARADGGHKIEMSSLPLDELLRDVYRQLQPTADGVALELVEPQPTTVVGNGTWLKQLLLILMDNALKYTPRGGTVKLSLRQVKDRAFIEVQDSGMGIEPRDLPLVFDRFYRADRARVRNEGGAGLGLSIAQWIAHEHRGDIDVRSEVGRGTTFSVQLPVG